MAWEANLEGFLGVVRFQKDRLASIGGLDVHRWRSMDQAVRRVPHVEQPSKGARSDMQKATGRGGLMH